MFVQYSFVQPRVQPMMVDTGRAVEMNPSLVVATGLIGMLVTACAYLWG